MGDAQVRLVWIWIYTCFDIYSDLDPEAQESEDLPA